MAARGRALTAAAAPAPALLVAAAGRDRSGGPAAPGGGPPDRSGYGDGVSTGQGVAPLLVQLTRPFGAAFTTGAMGECAVM